MEHLRLAAAQLNTVVGDLPGLEQPDAFADLLARFVADCSGPSERPQTGN
jgi:hypothetical protein